MNEFLFATKSSMNHGNLTSSLPRFFCLTPRVKAGNRNRPQNPGFAPPWECADRDLNPGLHLGKVQSYH